MNNEKYLMSFTTGGLLLREAGMLASLYLDVQDWAAVREKTLSENLLQARTQASGQRVCRETISRLRQLSSAELGLLVSTHPQEQGYLLWLAACRQYRFVGEFAVEILRERYITLKRDLHHSEFDSFFNKKAECHMDLDNIKTATYKKLRQVLFRMLQEATLLTTDNMIAAALLSPKLLNVISQGNSQDILFFPVLESELKGVLP